MEQKEYQYLELHYYLKQHDHAMDAKLLNKAEAEMLKIVEEVANQLEIKVSINALPKKEGGLETFYEFIVAPENEALRNILFFFSGIIGTILADVIADWIKTDKQTEALKKENLQLQNQKLKKELAEMDAKETDNPKVVSLINDLAKNIAENNKVKIAKSNFYRNLRAEDKVTLFATQQVNQNLEPVSKENKVPREDFPKFIIEEAYVEPDYKDQVEIEIISPVLDNSKKHWRGIHNDIAFNFAMKDREFQNMVVQKNLRFSNGTYLVADLEVKQRIDSEGDIKIKGRDVYSVTQIIYPDGEIIDIVHAD